MLPYKKGGRYEANVSRQAVEMPAPIAHHRRTQSFGNDFRRFPFGDFKVDDPIHWKRRQPNRITRVNTQVSDTE
jgi:hypothetical protein